MRVGKLVILFYSFIQCAKHAFTFVQLHLLVFTTLLVLLLLAELWHDTVACPSVRLSVTPCIMDKRYIQQLTKTVQI